MDLDIDSGDLSFYIWHLCDCLSLWYLNTGSHLGIHLSGLWIYRGGDFSFVLGSAVFAWGACFQAVKKGGAWSLVPVLQIVFLGIFLETDSLYHLREICWVSFVFPCILVGVLVCYGQLPAFCIWRQWLWWMHGKVRKRPGRRRPLHNHAVFIEGLRTSTRDCPNHLSAILQVSIVASCIVAIFCHLSKNFKIVQKAAQEGGALGYPGSALWFSSFLPGPQDCVGNHTVFSMGGGWKFRAPRVRFRFGVRLLGKFLDLRGLNLRYSSKSAESVIYQHTCAWGQHLSFRPKSWVVAEVVPREENKN